MYPLSVGRKSSGRATRYLQIISLAALLTLASGSAAATDLNNIETITPAGTSQINVTGELSMEGNPISNFFGSQCNNGNVAVHVNDDGTLDCVDATGEVQGDFVDRTGDSMTGNLDMQSNNILTSGNINGIDLDNPGNAISVSSGQYIVSSGAIQSNELDETDSYSLGWSNLAIAQSDVSAADVGLGNVRNVDLSNTAGSYLTYSTTNENYNVQAGNMNWGDLAVSQNDISVSNLGAADGNLDMNNNQIQGFDQLVTGQGGRVMTINNPSGGSSEIRFRSGSNTGSDHAYIEYFDNYIDNSNSETSRFLIGVENDGDGSDYQDELELRAANDVILTASNGSNGGGGEIQFRQGSTVETKFEEDGGLNMGGNSINDVDWANSDNPNTDSQDLSYSNDNAPTGNYATHSVNIQNGANINIRDYYEPNTDASTECSGNDYLAGDGTCNFDSTEDYHDLGNVLADGNSVNSGQTIDASSGAFRLPVGADAY